jgi:hypothetical protein
MIAYTVAVGRSWHSTDGTPAPDYTCGHKHRTASAAQACGSKLYGERCVRGSWQANARWHDYYIVDNATGCKVQS